MSSVVFTEFPPDDFKKILNECVGEDIAWQLEMAANGKKTSLRVYIGQVLANHVDGIDDDVDLAREVGAL